MEASKHIPAKRLTFSLAEFQSMIGISRSTVYRMMADGQLRTVKC
jgi:predicted DNA-binding transcriptional regulator AlpA